MYIPRVVDAELAARLRSSGAVLLEGAKACGKTETARQQAASESMLDIDPQARAAATVAPELILDRKPPVLIDEWQLEPSLWDHVRRAVDQRNVPGQFILTGSATPTDDARRHSGAGRFAVVRMRPMSLLETGHSSGAMSLHALLDGRTQQSSDSGPSIAELAERITVGGWPAFQHLAVPDAARSIRDYLTQIGNIDVSVVEGRRRDPVKVSAFIRSLARNVATEAAVTTIAADSAGNQESIDRSTAASYLDALERLMIVENQPAWAPRMRSRSQLRTTPKRHFVDPSLAVAALRGNPDRLLNDLETMGLLFESLVVRDLRVLSQPLDGEVFHYRDNKGLEVDAIVACQDGRWGAFEVKLGHGQIETAAERLRYFAEKVDSQHVGQPGVLGIITGSGIGYRRADGVQVIPIGALGL